MIKLTVVIGTFNRKFQLKTCLDSLIGRIKTDHQIIVADAGSSDGTVEFVEGVEGTGVKLIKDGERLGQAKSLNRIIKDIESKYVCWLSDDNIVADGILDAAVGILEQNSCIGMVSLKVKDAAGPNVKLPYIGGIWQSGILNCNQGMLPAALMKDVGGFDESFMDYGIDADLTTKVLLSGYKVVFTKEIAVHHVRDHAALSWIDEEGRQKRMTKARELYRQKYAALIQSDYGGKYDKSLRLNSLRMRAVDFLYDSTGVAFEHLLGVSNRDWRNLIGGRFISRWDLLRNFRKPYYLVQSIPEELRIKLVNKMDGSSSQ